jgi:glucan phosphoethanolaminetransferase (alkaline phosphatase superfamily)
MNFNPMLIPTVLLGYAFFFAGYRISSKITSTRGHIAWSVVAVLLFVPGMLIPMYYLHWFDHWKFFYSFRAAPFSELTASASGFLAGTLALWALRLRANRIVMVTGMILILTLGLAAPYVKPVLAPVDPSVYRNKWRDGVCIQSTASCGAASAATILRLYGIDATEHEVADECYTYVSGTENWYLARALRRRGLNVEFVFAHSPVRNLPVPSIAGINMGQAGHFITILDETVDDYIIGDPLSGRSSRPKDQVFERISFTGFFLHVTREEPTQR